jgi:hypothetical protein
MTSVFKGLFASVGQHVSDEMIACLVSGEMGGTRLRKAERHLAKCWKCRSRYEELDRAAMGFVELHKHVSTPHPPQASQWREVFVARLNQTAEELPQGGRLARWFAPHRFSMFTVMNPTVASLLVVALAAVVLLLIWQRSVVTVSAAELLDRAEVSETDTSLQRSGGVVYQRVRIKTPHNTLERDLYRDQAGRRKVKHEAVSPELEQLKIKLEFAGVDWQAPLSAASYRSWHDRQWDAQDEVRQPTKDRFMLTTRTAGGVVASESLTVRANDFHPMQRTVELTDVGTIRIEEVNYAVLSWDAVNADLFEPATKLAAKVAAANVVAHALPGPVLPSAEELVDVELRARLILNHLNADTVEQIRVVRGTHGVEVKGVVDTEDRKQEIVANLRAIPHVTSSILSIEELNRNPAAVADVTSIQQYFLVGQPSPLENYLIKDMGRAREDLSLISKRLLDASLIVQREASALSELQERFAPGDPLRESARLALNELVGNHAGALLAGLDAEAEGIQYARLSSAAAENGEIPSLPIGARLASADDGVGIEAAANQSLCQELITSADGQARPASAIAVDLLATIERLRSVVTQLRQSQGL